MNPKRAEDFQAEAALLKMKADMLRVSAAVLDVGAAASAATAGLKRFADALAPIEEWPDIVLEDVLDAEVIGE